MKQFSQATFIIFLLIICLSTAVEHSDPQRKSSRQSSNTPPLLNSLSSSQDASTKHQTAHQTQSSQQHQSIPYNKQPLGQLQQDFTPGQAQSAVYSHVQSVGQPSGAPQGYILSVGAQQGTITAGPTPVIMQYLPQSQPTNGIQYLQLIPTRPLIVPISPYISQIPTYNSNSVQPVSTSATATSAPAQYAPTSAYTHSSHPSYSSSSIHQGPVGGYSTPVVSYFRPHTGIQLINGPVDMSLNTNEYIPIQGESSYKIRRS